VMLRESAMGFERCIQAMRMRVHVLFQRDAVDRELENELAYHVEMKTEENIARGMSRDEARRAALIDAGGIEVAKENCRETRGVNWIHDLGQDLRFGLRMMRKNLGFTAVAVLTLALGIGANTAIFSVINAMLLKTLPVKEPKQLVMLNWASANGWPGEDLIYNAAGSWNQEKSGRLVCWSFPYYVYQQIVERNQAFSNVAAVAGNGSALSVAYGGEPAQADGQYVSGSFFATLGVRAVAGRMFDESDDRLGATPAVVLGYGYWQRRFGGDVGIVGRMIEINGAPATVEGVSEPGFFGIQPGRSVDVWLPLHAQLQLEPNSPPPPPGKQAGSPWVFEGHDTWWLVLVGRLKSGVSEQQADAELKVIFQQAIAGDLKSGDPADKIPHLGTQPGGKGMGNQRFGLTTPLFLLMGVVGLVLLIACINIANLLLARGAARQKEIAVRLAVGARRGRLVRQLLTESVMLAGTGAAAGMLLALWGTRILLLLMGSGGTAIALDVAPDVRVLSFTAGLALVAGVLFGLSPALRATRVDLTPSLRESGGAFGSGRGYGARIGLGGALVIAQVSLSLVLLVGAGLFIRTLVNLQHASTGFNTQNLLLFGVDATHAGYAGARLADFYEELERRIEALPGVRSVSASHSTLIGGGGNFQMLQIPGYMAKARENVGAAINWVGPNFFRTMGIPFALGRDIAESDTSDAPKVIVVNEQFVRQFFSGANPLGRHITLGKKTDVEIVGVVSDAKYFDLRSAAPATIYPPWVQESNLNTALHFEVRTAADPRGLMSSVQQLMAAMDKKVSAYDMKTEVEQIDQSLFATRILAELTSFFGALAALLASVGLYGVMAFGVSRRTREIGVRVALGASRGEIVGMVVREMFVLVAMGLGIGVAAALGASRLIASFLYGVTPSDPFTCAAVCAVLAGVALAACVVPAHRASLVDPMVALRHE